MNIITTHLRGERERGRREIKPPNNDNRTRQNLSGKYLKRPRAPECTTHPRCGGRISYKTHKMFRVSKTIFPVKTGLWVLFFFFSHQHGPWPRTSSTRLSFRVHAWGRAAREAVAVWRCRPDFTGARQRGGADRQSDPPAAATAAARRILSVRQTVESPAARTSCCRPVFSAYDDDDDDRARTGVLTVGEKKSHDTPLVFRKTPGIPKKKF